MMMMMMMVMMMMTMMMAMMMLMMVPGKAIALHVVCSGTVFSYDKRKNQCAISE